RDARIEDGSTRAEAGRERVGKPRAKLVLHSPVGMRRQGVQLYPHQHLHLGELRADKFASRAREHSTNRTFSAGHGRYG
ncbi:hypothetical protein B8W95_13625, partial [Staphylococcus pasteuri]